jgi:hypothetical protein
VRVVVVGCDRVGAGLAAGPLEPADEVLALTTLQAEPDLRRLLGGPTPRPADRPACGTLPPRNGM